MGCLSIAQGLWQLIKFNFGQSMVKIGSRESKSVAIAALLHAQIPISQIAKQDKLFYCINRSPSDLFLL